MNVLEKLSKIEIIRPKSGDIIMCYTKDVLLNYETKQNMIDSITETIRKQMPDLTNVTVMLSTSLEGIEIIRKEE